jgi:hypothetical protein
MTVAPPAGTVADFYDDPIAPTDNTFKDVPVETSPDSTNHSDPNRYLGNAGRPIADLDMNKSGTYNNSATVFLQRLADPSAPYHNVVNPYITMDWATIDVTVFSGEENSARPVGTPATGEPVDPEDPGTPGPFSFRTRQRGALSDTGLPTYNLWSPITQNNLQTAPAGTTNYFNVDLSNDGTAPYNASVDRHTLGYLNQTIDEVNTGYGPPYAGEPEHPMPWLTWNNRPFSNPLELLTVPSSSPSRAMFEVTPGYLTYHMAAGPYGDTSNLQVSGFRGPFAHLLNFHWDQNDEQQMHLARLLDFVEVPSPYVGAERWYNPKQGFGGLTGAQFTGITPPGFTYPIYYRPPFNKLSRFRDPGKININTIFEPEVWSAGMAQFPGLGSTNYFSQVVGASRKGATGGNWYDSASNFPTRFANPFRAADAFDLMPNGMRHTTPVQATLLRTDPYTADPTRQPLFQINQNNPATSAQHPQWTGFGTGTGEYRNIDRNPYFRYQGLQKMGNTFTTQSNCFAVWITIGYFEVEDAAVFSPTLNRNVTWSEMRPDQKNAWPDGLMLGQEVGADSGEINRHRAFFIIDRSIPVGFMPGSRLNTDDCVLVRRLIE